MKPAAGSREPALVFELPPDSAAVSENLHALLAKARNVAVAPPPPGLGDMAAAALAAIGITKERVSAAVGGPCGCEKRAAWLNAAGAKWLGLPPGTTPPPEIDPGTP